jgi:hypothetical protein
LGLYNQMKLDVPEITRSPYAIKAIDAIFDRPIFQSSDFIKHYGIPEDSALRILGKLKKHGVVKLMQEARGRQPAVLIFGGLIKITER